MIKQISKITIVLIIFLSIASSVLAYSDDLFKFDLPSSYANLSYDGMNVFVDAENPERGIMIFARKDSGLKKSVWNIDDSDLNSLLRILGRGYNIIETNKKSKLGKEKAVNVVLKDATGYFDIYILASNKYIYMVTFTGTSESELENDDYKMIKKSFKLKDRTTNPTVIYILIAIVGIGIRCFISYRKNNRKIQSYTNNNEIDYKNMTEEDFKRIDELNKY